MQLCSSSAKSQFSPRLFISQNPNPPKFFSKISVKSLSPPPLIKLPASSSSSSKQSTPSVKETLLSLQSESDSEDDEEEKEKGDNDKIRGGVGSDGILVIRRPMIDSPASSSLESKEESPSSVQESEDGQGASQMASARSAIDQGLSEFAKKMPIFEPKRTNGGTEKPLTVNLDLALYRAKGLARNFQHAEAEKLLLQMSHTHPKSRRSDNPLSHTLGHLRNYMTAPLWLDFEIRATGDLETEPLLPFHPFVARISKSSHLNHQKTAAAPVSSFYAPVKPIAARSLLLSLQMGKPISFSNRRNPSARWPPCSDAAARFGRSSSVLTATPLHHPANLGRWDRPSLLPDFLSLLADEEIFILPNLATSWPSNKSQSSSTAHQRLPSSLSHNLHHSKSQPFDIVWPPSHLAAHQQQSMNDRSNTTQITTPCAFRITSDQPSRSCLLRSSH
ncbi:hypothetical protein ACLOJK_026521 [Asimina triloba]